MRNPTEVGREAAREVRRRYHVSDVDLDIIVYLIGQMGYDLIDYTPKDDAMLALSDALDITSILKNGAALTFSQGENHLVFVRDCLDVEEKKYVLAHELGHIACGHRGTQFSYIEEQEANEFVHYFMKPSVRAWVQKHKVIFLVSIAALVILGAALIFTQPHFTKYYVTENGRKYHLRDCIVIHDRTKLRKLTEEELAGEIYEPCEICLPPL